MKPSSNFEGISASPVLKAAILGLALSCAREPQQQQNDPKVIARADELARILNVSSKEDIANIQMMVRNGCDTIYKYDPVTNKVTFGCEEEGSTQFRELEFKDPLPIQANE